MLVSDGMKSSRWPAYCLPFVPLTSKIPTFLSQIKQTPLHSSNSRKNPPQAQNGDFQYDKLERIRLSKIPYTKLFQIGDKINQQRQKWFTFSTQWFTFYRQSIDVDYRISPGHLFLLTLKVIITHKPSRNRILHGHTRIVYHSNDTEHDI